MTKLCKQCGADFFARARGGRRQRASYCSRECWSKGVSAAALGGFARRFWSHVDIGPMCWRWTGFLTDKGYGAIRINGRNVRAHRMAWTIVLGAIPAGLHVLHSCDVRDCVNPSHLFLGTHAENMIDRERKGRGTMAAARVALAAKRLEARAALEVA